MLEFSTMDVLDIWYARVEFADYLAMLPQDRRAALDVRIARATAHASSELVFPKLIEQNGGQPRIRDRPPLIFHPREAQDAGRRRPRRHDRPSPSVRWRGRPARTRRRGA